MIDFLKFKESKNKGFEMILASKIYICDDFIQNVRQNKRIFINWKGKNLNSLDGKK